jgi:hypothetical protein
LDIDPVRKKPVGYYDFKAELSFPKEHFANIAKILWQGDC